MVVKKREGAKKPAKKTRTRALKLPTEPSSVAARIEDYLVWLYGKPKIGKTTVAAKMDKPLFICSEQGTKALSVYDVFPETWNQFLEYSKLFKESKDFKNGVVDVVEYFYDMAYQYVAKRDGFVTPEWGQWDDIKTEFMRAMLSLTRCNKGVMFISHVALKSRKDEEGEEVEDLQPSGIKGKAFTAFAGHMDIIAYYSMRYGKRFLQIRQDDTVMAGCRLVQQFRHADDGSEVKFIPMGTSETESHENWIRAFENQQTLAHTAELLKKPVRKTKKPVKKKITVKKRRA